MRPLAFNIEAVELVVVHQPCGDLNGLRFGEQPFIDLGLQRARQPAP